MARRRKDPLEGIVQAIGALFVLAFVFIPHFGWYLVWGIGLVLIGGVVFIAAKRAGQRNSHLSGVASVDSEIGCAELPRIKATPTLAERLRTLDWFQFEKLVAAVYQSHNYTVARIGGANPDGGVDLIVENSATKFVVQCKQWKSWKVGVRHIREFLGTLTDSGVRKGVFITLQGYTDEARELAAKHGIDLLDEQNILSLLEEVNWKYNPAILSALDATAKRCPRCESEIILRIASKGKNAGGQFWGCLKYPKCRFVLSV